MIPENRRRKRKRFPQLVRSAEFSARGSIKVFAHKAHAVCGQHNFVISIHVTPGNIHNSAAFNLLYDDIAGTISNTKSFLTTAPTKKHHGVGKESLAAVFGPHSVYIPLKTKDGNHIRYTYVNDEYYDYVIYPKYNILHYVTTNRDGEWEYRSWSIVPQEPCAQNEKGEKTLPVTCGKHLWKWRRIFGTRRSIGISISCSSRKLSECSRKH